MSFLSEPLTDRILDISPSLDYQSWQQAQIGRSATEQWNYYLNQVSLATVLPWVRAEQADYAASFTPDSALNSTTQENTTHLSSPLENVTVADYWLPGAAIALNERPLHPKRLILIPSKTLDTSELRVPQEWIDIPAWAGDYFLAVQVEPDDLTVRIWGYTTHQQLKTQGIYEASDRTYSLAAEYLVQDISALWAVRQWAPNEITQAAIAPIPALSASQAETLLTDLADDPQMLRLTVPFQQWAALLTNSNLLQRLLQLRYRPSPNSAEVAPLVRLGQWLHNQFEDGWQTLETLLGTAATGDVGLAYGLRRSDQDEDITSIRRVKRLQLPDQEVLLVVEIASELQDAQPSDRLSIRVQLRSLDLTAVLPEAVSLTLLSADGTVIQTVQTRDQDNLIQLKRFRCTPDTRFSLQIAISNHSIIGNFLA